MNEIECSSCILSNIPYIIAAETHSIRINLKLFNDRKSTKDHFGRFRRHHFHPDGTLAVALSEQLADALDNAFWKKKSTREKFSYRAGPRETLELAAEGPYKQAGLFERLIRICIINRQGTIIKVYLACQFN